MGSWARVALLVSDVVAVGACGVEDELGVESTSIIGGESTSPGNFAATGALLHGRGYRCTATLIAPDVAITAAHCLGNSGFGDFAFTLDASLNGSTEHVAPVVDVGFKDVPGVDATSVPQDDVVSALVVHQHPGFNPGSTDTTHIGQVNDIGVVILKRPILNVPVEQLDRPYDGLVVGTGTELELAAYGVAEWYARDTVGVKRNAMVLVDLVGAYELRTAPVAPQPCKGDSGGPLFLDTPGGGRRITGLVSRGVGDSFQCDQGAIATLVAPYVDWIAEASQDRDPGCAVGGGGGGWPALLAWLPMVLRRRARRG